MVGHKPRGGPVPDALQTVLVLRSPAEASTQRPLHPEALRPPEGQVAAGDNSVEGAELGFEP